MIGPRRTWRARAVRRKAPVEAGLFHRGGACARGGSFGGAHSLSLIAAAVTANGVTTPSKRPSLRYRRRPWGARSQWAARPCRGSGLLAAPFGLVHGDQRHLCLDTKAPMMREGLGSVARYFYRRVRLLGRSLAFGFGLLGWRCARSAQCGVPCSHEGASGSMVSDGAGRVGTGLVSPTDLLGIAQANAKHRNATMRNAHTHPPTRKSTHAPSPL